MTKSCVVIQCRYDSSRLPGKILKELTHNLTCLDYLIARMQKMGLQIIIATTDQAEDKEIVVHYINKYLNDNTVDLYQGSKLNIAERLYNATEGYQYILRVTGDDLFVDTNIAKDMLSIANNLNYDYVFSSIVRGCDCDIIKRTALAKAMRDYNTETIEFLEFLFKNGKFNTYKFNVDKRIDCNQVKFSMSMDTQEDWKLIKIVFNRLYKDKPFFSAKDLFELFSENYHLEDINRTPKVTVYTVYKDYPIGWLKEAIQSLQRQTFTDYEYIFLDYGSQMIHSFIKDNLNQNEFRTFMTEKMTFIEAIQYAIKKSSGKYILRLDADDELKTEALDEMVRAIEEDDASIVIPNHDRCVDGVTSLDLPIMHKSVLTDYINCPGDIDNVMSCCLVEKKKYQYVNFMDKQEFRDGTNILESFKKYNFKIRYLNKSLFYYRVHGKSLTFDKAKVTEADKQLKEKLC